MQQPDLHRRPARRLDQAVEQPRGEPAAGRSVSESHRHGIVVDEAVFGEDRRAAVEPGRGDAGQSGETFARHRTGGDAQQQCHGQQFVIDVVGDMGDGAREPGAVRHADGGDATGLGYDLSRRQVHQVLCQRVDQGLDATSGVEQGVNEGDIGNAAERGGERLACDRPARAGQRHDRAGPGSRSSESTETDKGLKSINTSPCPSRHGPRTPGARCGTLRTVADINPVHPSGQWAQAGESAAGNSLRHLSPIVQFIPM